MKKITIGSRTYEMKASAYTQFKYKNDTGRSLIKDMSELQKKYGKMSKDITDDNALEKFDDLDDFITLALRIGYIMAVEGKSVNGSFEDFLMGIDNYLDNLDWISEVVELAITPLSRNVQGVQQ